MRHWYRTARMIEWEKTGTAYQRVNYQLDHDQENQTKRYLEFSCLFNENNGSWLSRALKQGSIGGLLDSNVFTQQVCDLRSVEQSYFENNGRVCWDLNPG